jgi:hypothetical protein
MRSSRAPLNPLPLRASAARALEAGRTSFVEKPVAATLEQADALASLAAARGRVLQVGHIERFSAAFRAVVARRAGTPALHWEGCARRPSGRARSNVSVVLDLMTMTSTWS